jgi:hypothetical protein
MLRTLQKRRWGAANLGGGVAPLPAFSPLDVPGLLAWYDLSDITTLYQANNKTTSVTSDGQTIGLCADKSGNNFDAKQSNAARRPLYKTGIQNSLSAMLANASTYAYLIATIDNSISDGDLYIATVLKTRTLATTKGLYDFGNKITLNAGNFSGYKFSSYYVTYSDIIASSNTPYIIGLSRVSYVVNCWINGVLSGFYEDDNEEVINNPESLTLGLGGGTYWYDYIMECCVYAGCPTSYITQLHSYFNTKWVVY